MYNKKACLKGKFFYLEINNNIFMWNKMDDILSIDVKDYYLIYR
ncbi:hypothetical protein QIT93_03810 [Clostridium baratii]